MPRSLDNIGRNHAISDWWSLTHIAWGVILGWLFGPKVAIIVLFLWEPVEIFFVSKVVMKHFDYVFGHEGLKNSVSDLIMDSMGVAIAYYLLNPIIGLSPFIV